MYFASAQLFLVSPFRTRTSLSQPHVAADPMMMMAKKSPNPTDKYVGSRVRMRRLMLGMSQEKLGERLGLTFQQVQKYEKDGTSKAPVADYVSEFLSSSDGLALTKAFTNIKDSKLRRRVVDLVEEIAGDQR